MENLRHGTEVRLRAVDDKLVIDGSVLRVCRMP